MTIPFHPVAEIFPLLEGDDFARLADDIAANGLRDPILLADGKIADGRNRYRACEAKGVKPRFEKWDGKESLTSLVVSRNLHRRHLDESQRAMVGARLIPMFEEEAQARKKATQRNGHSPVGVQGTPPGKQGENGRSAKKAAEAVNVSEASVKRAKKVLQSGNEELATKVEKGEVTVREAERQVKQPAKPAPETDPAGLPIPEKLVATFQARERFKALRSLLRQAAQLIGEIADAPGGEVYRLDLTLRGAGAGKEVWKSPRLIEELEKIGFAEPYASVCPWCHEKHPGKSSPKCTGCHGRGWVVKKEWDNPAMPPEYRQAVLRDCAEVG